jgi:hypothetical protein
MPSSPLPERAAMWLFQYHGRLDQSSGDERRLMILLPDEEFGR